MVMYLLLVPAATGLIPSAPKNVSQENIVDVAEVNQRRCCEESRQWLDNVGQTHLVLAAKKEGSTHFYKFPDLRFGELWVHNEVQCHLSDQFGKLWAHN